MPRPKTVSATVIVGSTTPDASGNGDGLVVETNDLVGLLTEIRDDHPEWTVLGAIPNNHSSRRAVAKIIDTFDAGAA